jgi:thiol-disulfide isomerase/thioredoxin
VFWKTVSIALSLWIALPLVSFAVDDELIKMLTLTPEQYADDAAATQTAEELEKAYPAEARPEAVKMLVDILRGSNMGPQEGWFGPARTRFTWEWLAKRHELGADAKEIPQELFKGSEAQWKVLDRDGSGTITPQDLDWSDRNPWVQQAYLVSRLFRRLNSQGDGRLKRSELDAFFDRAASGKDHLTLADVRSALLGNTGAPGDMPSRDVLVRGFISGEVGSMHEGPRPGDAAPDFTLKSPDGSTTHQLSKLIGDRPVVLVFGNFTCGPFRAFYPEANDLFERYKGEATFLMIYVREAHPLDGWKMESNAKAGVEAIQPKSLSERTAVCTQFCERLKPTMPVAVDDVNDAVGNAYSAMPARLYLIGTDGKVAYQSGRGPFGFKVPELEQALVMSLLEIPADK